MKVGPPPMRPTSISHRHDGRTAPSGPMMPKPSVALWRAKPMIRTVARVTAPALAETPIASPSAKLWSPIAVAMTRPVWSARRRARSVCSPSLAASSASIPSSDRAERADDAEALGRVVEGEADDQDRREGDRPGPGGDADREPLGEVVEPDRGGDDEAGLERPPAREICLLAEPGGVVRVDH